MPDIESIFNEHFATWEIRLPVEALAHRRRGRIAQSGWTIWYLFGSDTDGEYLDYYSSHRMTNDRHVRIHADGRCEDLPAFQDFRVCSDDPEEDARLEEAYCAGNERVAALLREKGFVRMEGAGG